VHFSCASAAQAFVEPLDDEPLEALPVLLEALPVLLEVLPVLVEVLPVLLEVLPEPVEVLPVLVEVLPVLELVELPPISEPLLLEPQPPRVALTTHPTTAPTTIQSLFMKPPMC
jgi:hypothetical protein